MASPAARNAASHRERSAAIQTAAADDAYAARLG